MKPISWLINSWHRLFQIGVIIKALDGLLETMGGVLFVCVNKQTILHTIFRLTQHALVEDPDDWMANHLRAAFSHFSGGNKIFAITYLLGHGVVKLALAVGLWRGILWTFPAGLAVLAAFIGYQTFRMARGFSSGLCILTIIDIAIFVLVWREYRRLKRRKK